MSEAKRYEAVHLRYEESNIRYGEGCEVEVVAAYDFDTLAQRLQEAERLLRETRSGLYCENLNHKKSERHEFGEPCKVLERIDAKLASLKGVEE